MSDQQNGEVPMVNVQIDGDWHKVPKGTRMIEAIRMARDDGSTVPHYCYHPKLTSPGNCRMCLVEMGMPPRPTPGQEPVLDENGHQPIGWMPRAAIACANTVADGMGIRTESTLAQECRKGVMEFLLINHPLDCPICDQAGECGLQEHSVEHGNGESRFQETKVTKPKNVDIGARIVLDDERCIMCSRCIRFSDEIAEDDVLGFTERGSYTTLTTHPGKRLDNNYSLNTVDLCPVGALTSKDFRFQMRVWFLKETNSIDTTCGTGANIVIHSRENKVYRITPRQNDHVNSCWIPDSHRLNFHHLDSDLRLTEPLIKSPEGRHSIAAWPEATAATARLLKDCPSGETALILSGRMTNEELFMARRLAKSIGIPAENIDIVPRTGEADSFLVSADKNPNTEGARNILSIWEPGKNLPAIREKISSGTIKAVFAWHEDLLSKEAGFTKEQLAPLRTIIYGGTMACDFADMADVILPLSEPQEKRGSMINVTGRLQRLNKAVDAPGIAGEDWEVLRDITSAAGGGNGLYMVEEVFKAMVSEHEKFTGLTLGKIGDLGIQLYETDTKIPLLAKEAERKAKGLIPG